MTDQTEGQDENGIDIGAPSAVDDEQRKRRETVKARKAREDREFFRMVAASEVGRRLLWDILKKAHTFEVIFAYGGPVPHDQASWFKLGEQLLGLQIYQEWHLKEPEGVMLMLRENDARFKGIDV